MSTDSQPPQPSAAPDVDDDRSPYVEGEAHPNRQDYATFETKPSPPNFTGGGYEHWRSNEYRPHTPGTNAEDVYCSHHRLLAVVECYDVDEPLDSVLEDLAGKDVHHTTGVPWCNFGASPNFDEPGIETLDHGRHSEITQTQRRAWAEDAKREVEEAEQQPLAANQGPECPECGETDVPLGTMDGFDGEACPSCLNDRRERQEALDELESLHNHL